MAKHPSRNGVHLPIIMQDYGASDFSDAFAHYWVKLTQPGLSPQEVKHAANNYYLPFQKISVFHKVKFYNVDLKGYPGSSDPHDSVHARPCQKGKHGQEIAGRFDTALVSLKGQHIQGDIHGEICSIL